MPRMKCSSIYRAESTIHRAAQGHIALYVLSMCSLYALYKLSISSLYALYMLSKTHIENKTHIDSVLILGSYVWDTYARIFACALIVCCRYSRHACFVCGLSLYLGG
jgi:hypothetical protein